MQFQFQQPEFARLRTSILSDAGFSEPWRLLVPLALDWSGRRASGGEVRRPPRDPSEGERSGGAAVGEKRRRGRQGRAPSCPRADGNGEVELPPILLRLDGDGEVDLPPILLPADGDGEVDFPPARELLCGDGRRRGSRGGRDPARGWRGRSSARGRRGRGPARADGDGARSRMPTI